MMERKIKKETREERGKHETVPKGDDRDEEKRGKVTVTVKLSLCLAN
jgi:hypothetical protein